MKKCYVNYMKIYKFKSVCILKSFLIKFRQLFVEGDFLAQSRYFKISE